MGKKQLGQQVLAPQNEMGQPQPADEDTPAERRLFLRFVAVALGNVDYDTDEMMFGLPFHVAVARFRGALDRDIASEKDETAEGTDPTTAVSEEPAAAAVVGVPVGVPVKRTWWAFSEGGYYCGGPRDAHPEGCGGGCWSGTVGS